MFFLFNCQNYIAIYLRFFLNNDLEVLFLLTVQQNYRRYNQIRIQSDNQIINCKLLIHHHSIVTAYGTPIKIPFVIRQPVLLTVQQARNTVVIGIKHGSFVIYVFLFCEFTIVRNLFCLLYPILTDNDNSFFIFTFYILANNCSWYLLREDQ